MRLAGQPRLSSRLRRISFSSNSQPQTFKDLGEGPGKQGYFLRQYQEGCQYAGGAVAGLKDECMQPVGQELTDYDMCVLFINGPLQLCNIPRFLQPRLQRPLHGLLEKSAMSDLHSNETLLCVFRHDASPFSVFSRRSPRCTWCSEIRVMCVILVMHVCCVHCSFTPWHIEILRDCTRSP